ncbi:4-amino-6-deoxy-N-Acetyl-D-hexosaminyl-(Lipid carrier) acetyltrasferase [hydrothermal vent metagenome]|uniref:4-amino-6-deoxy-N-Acetyl-D-hexosaminyl-(Lipid carrier) acetyltrasferase n=1 Tax=hydrothermal vent metagenome TaxID=652676 RepID=A0A3B0Y7H3_9ZZZZ
MKCLAILGASGHGKVVADCAESAGWDKVFFFDDAWPKCNVNGAWVVVGNTETLLNNLSNYDGVVVAIGDNAIRCKKQNDLFSQNAPLVSIVHPSAVISHYAKLGVGSVIMAGAVINVDSKLGSSCIVNTAATIDHDCVLGDGVHISPGAQLAGGVIVGDGSWIGIGANVCQLITIGNNSIVGAGAVVINNVKNMSTVVGVPANYLSDDKI